MQAVMETIFDIVYLCTVIALGVRMITGAGERKQIKLFGIMAVVLGCGDAFHLVPRAYALCTDGLANHAAALGFGKLVTSVTMTVFYSVLHMEDAVPRGGKERSDCRRMGAGPCEGIPVLHAGQ